LEQTGEPGSLLADPVGGGAVFVFPAPDITAGFVGLIEERAEFVVLGFPRDVIQLGALRAWAANAYGHG
jgi:hypothetical protein